MIVMEVNEINDKKVSKLYDILDIFSDIATHSR